MKPDTEIEGFRPLRARVNEHDQIRIDRSDPSDPSDFSGHRDNYLQTEHADNDHYDKGWQDGYKARGSWIRFATGIIVSMLALAAAIVIATRQ